MNQSKKVALCSIIGTGMAILSLGLSIVTINTTQAATGVAYEAKKIYKVSFNNITDVFDVNEGVDVVKKPIIEDNSISYGIDLKKLNAQAVYEFSVVNDGNVDALVKDISVLGLNEFIQNVDVTIEGISVNQVVKPHEVVKVKVITTYKNAFYDATNSVSNITLSNIKVSVDLEDE